MNVHIHILIFTLSCQTKAGIIPAIPDGQVKFKLRSADCRLFCSRLVIWGEPVVHWQAAAFWWNQGRHAERKHTVSAEKGGENSYSLCHPWPWIAMKAVTWWTAHQHHRAHTSSLLLLKPDHPSLQQSDVHLSFVALMWPSSDSGTEVGRGIVEDNQSENDFTRLNCAKP